MAATSLAEQLQKLSVPQSSIFKDDLKKASLLFNPKEAAAKDRDTFYEIGLSGLKELIALYEGFRVYEDTLFSLSSKDFERAVQSKETNKNLDQTVEKFLYQLAPYLLLQSSHKALEWLVNRYHIHQYNQDAIMALILPYHETKIFTRFIQLMNVKSSSNRWNWLHPLQKPGVPLAKQILYNQCVSNTATLQFIAKSTLKYVEEYGERASQLNTVFAFFCSTVIGTIDTAKKVREQIVNALLPTLMKALESPIQDFRSSAYVILGYLTTKAAMKEDTVSEIVEKLLLSEFDISYDMILLTNLIYSTQTHVSNVSDEILCSLSADTMNVLSQQLQKLIEQNISAHSFIIKFLSSILPMIQADSEMFKVISDLPKILIEIVDFKMQQPENIIRCVIQNYKPQRGTQINDDEDDGESDIEIVEEDKFSINILHWYSALLKNLETKYPVSFDKVIMQELKNNSSKKRQAQLSKLLGFKPSLAHKVGGTTLFEQLNHPNAVLRVEAVQYITKNFQTLTKENIDFVRDSIISRFNDDNHEVVSAALDIPTDYLQEVLREDDITGVFINVISRDLRHYKKWKPVVNAAIVKFCSLDVLPVTQDLVLVVMPHLFPTDAKTATVAWNIINSPWGRKFTLTKNIKGLNTSIAKDNHEIISQTMFKELCVKRQFNFDDILDINSLDKTKTLSVCFYLLLKSCSIKKSSIEDITNVLDLLLSSIENCDIYPSSDGDKLSSHLFPEFINLARQDKILFELMEYVFTRIIEDMQVTELSKPWCNVCKTPDTILIRRLYEICVTGSFIPTYSQNYAKLLSSLMNKLCSNAKEKIEFIANVACGHILYAADPKDIISPELQLRSLKLLDNYIVEGKDVKWIYDSDVVLLMILFDLNNPVSIVRQSVIDIISNILKNQVEKSNTNAQLLKQLFEHKEELILDHEQLPQVLCTILTQQTPETKVFRRNCLLRLMSILIGQTPAHITSEFLNILQHLNNSNVFSHIVPSLGPLEKQMKTESNPKFVFDVYESKLVRNVFGRINESTVSTFDKDQIWNSIAFGLKEYRECVLEEDQTLTSPSALIMRQLTDEVFKKMPENKGTELILLIASAGTFSNNPRISSVASKTIKKLQLNLSHFKPILDKMLTAVDPATTAQKKSKSSVSMLSYQLAETNEWKLGITLLEYVQTKKKMAVDNSFVNILFQLLNRCLRFEEQSYVEYVKQLILSSLWFYCKKFVNEKDKEQMKSLKSVFDIELVVQCIRGTQNPQTHHHALILLSHAAYLLPDQVLHHTMEIFTFMGTSVLRHDDAYSFQIITKIIETLIPILVKLDKNAEDYTDKELMQLQKRVVPVLRIFADAVLHVPEHRRLPLYRKLIETLGPNNFLWIFLALLLETHISHFNEGKEKQKKTNRNLADQESPLNRMDFGQSILLEFTPEVGLGNFIKLITYVKSLPLQKDEDSMETDVDASEIFSVNGHSAIQLRHYKYAIITFLNSCLSSSRFIHLTSQAEDNSLMESHYKTFIINILTFIQSISKVSDEKTAKYWRVMLHHSYDLLDNINNILSVNMFLSVIRGLLKHTLQTVRRKSMELLNSKIQFSPEFFADCDKDLFFSLLPALLAIVETIDTSQETTNNEVAQELELNQQTALLSLKLLTRMLATENPEEFKPVLEKITEYTCQSKIPGNVMASIVLCLAELCANLKAHALASLRKFMPALIKVLKKQREAETPELILLSTVTAIAKIVESLPLFLSPYLEKILYEYSILLAKWQSFDQGCSKVSAIVTKLLNIKKKIAGSIPPRILIPVVNQTHKQLLEKEEYSAVGPVMSVLADSFANVTTADFTSLQQELTTFFLSALQLRSDAVEKNVESKSIDDAEDEVVNALVCLVLKLSENSFRPFYFKIYDWAIRTNLDGHKDRAITFYRLSSAIAEKLKGLFVLFAGHFIKNAAELLDSCNTSKTESLFFEEEDKSSMLVNYILKTLQVVFLYDSQNFLNKERFETLMQSVVDQLENTLGGISSLKSRATDVLIPCISQFAVATADDSLWKLLNYQILLKTRHNDAEIRLTALDCLVAMATQLGSSWLPLLAESVPFLAELLEDGDSKIENATKDAIRKLEQILGEPLEKYF
ncbi:unnamed protein product [Plutella xylostella]|uniref:HEAT repeat-containing protein 1 n=1 Tax=Plutella xylostella TaxID=51655 RepID=A0A8S4F0J3_PLUXY|nr:unnamed protein product [Plutella xylostella]